MIFNVLGFNQEMLMNIMDEKQIKLNSNDLLVLRNIVDMINRNNLEVKSFNGITYTWIKYSLLVKNLPIISDKEDTFKKIVTKLINCGLLERQVIKSVGKGSYTYFRTTKLLTSIEYKKEESKPKRLKSKKITTPIDSNATTPLEGQVHISQFEEVCSDLIITPEKKISMVTNKFPNLKLSPSDIEFIISTNNCDLSCALNNIDDTYVYSFSYIKNAVSKVKSKKNSFCNFEGRDYDYEILEKKLLGWID